MWWHILLGPAVFLFVTSANAHDLDHPENNEWMMALSDAAGNSCCEITDNSAIKDVPWDNWYDDQGVKHYKVMIERDWIKVDDSKVVREPNKIGVPIVWIYRDNGMLIVKCFLPGSGL